MKILSDSAIAKWSTWTLRRIGSAVGLLLLLSALTACAQSPGWPQWRGPDRDGQLRDGSVWPEKLSEDVLTQEWRIPLDASYSGPIVHNGRIFVTETVDKQQEVVRAIELETGEELWKNAWSGAITVPFFAASNGSWIRSTPACDGDSLYVAGMRDVLVCLNTEDGSKRWRVDFVEKFGTPLPSFGFIASPLVFGEAVYVQAAGGFVKLDKQTGEVLWKTLDDGGGMWGNAFSSPTHATLGGVEQLLVQTRKSLCGVSVDDGKVLWEQEIPAFRGMNILTPTAIGDSQVFTSSYGGGSFLFSVTPTGDAWEVKELWKSKVQGYMSSPVVIDGHIYLHLRNQRVACLDVATGKDTWITKPYGKYWSMIVNGGDILALDQRGDMYLVHADPKEFVLKDSRKVSDEETWAHVAIVDDRVIVRDLTGLAVYRWNDKQ